MGSFNSLNASSVLGHVTRLEDARESKMQAFEMRDAARQVVDQSGRDEAEAHALSAAGRRPWVGLVPDEHGVLIMRDDELVAVRPCAGGQADMPVQYDAAERVFAQEDELFTDETMRADPDWSRE